MVATLDRRALLKGGAAATATALLAACTPGGKTPTSAGPGTSPALEPEFTESGTAQLEVLPPAVQAGLPKAMTAAVAAARPVPWKFGAALVDVDDGRVLLVVSNNTRSGDPTLHAEVHALRRGGLSGVALSKAVLVTTAESCPMCASAAVWARVAGVVYGTPIQFLIDSGFNQIRIGQPQVVAAGFVPMPVIGGFMRHLTDTLYSPGPPSDRLPQGRLSLPDPASANVTASRT
jgi:tRNA(Arg) A34 adenosine deaminase TadA